MTTRESLADRKYAETDAAGFAEPGHVLTVVIPTYNERDNIKPLLGRLELALDGIAWQAIIVDDDSPDGTAVVAKAVAGRDRRVECIRRVGRRGLAGAVIEGVMASAAPFVAVIDADLQHDESLLPLMLEALQSGRADLAIGSRYVDDPHAEGGLSRIRSFASRLAATLARRVLKVEVADPVSGFFMARRSVVEAVAPRLSNQGFKILFDIIACQPIPIRLVELPYAFASRQAGESKLDLRVVLEYLSLIIARFTGNRIPPRAILFFGVGSTGLVVQMAVMWLSHGAGLSFDAGLVIAGLSAMTSNYLVNNQVTYRDRRLSGVALLKGYVRFCGLCAVPLVINFSVAHLVYQQSPIWWLAGIAGAIFGAIWNYVSTSVAVW